MLIVVQVNGKIRGKVTLAADAAEEEIFRAAQEEENVRRFLGGQMPRKRHYVPGRLVSLVV
jgi:leucyl-tRNA synthetase